MSTAKALMRPESSIPPASAQPARPTGRRGSAKLARIGGFKKDGLDGQQDTKRLLAVVRRDLPSTYDEDSATKLRAAGNQYTASPAGKRLRESLCRPRASSA